MFRISIAHLILFVFTAPLISCQFEEDDLQEIHSTNSPITNQNFSKTGLINPQNENNPYDSIGILHNQYLERYWEEFHENSSLSEIMENLDAITSYSHTGSLVNFENILNQPDDAFENTLNRHLTSLSAKDSLISFLDYIDFNSDSDFTDLYNYIINYEEYISQNPAYPVKDKKLILSLTSFIRHGIHLKKRRDDKDWEISVASRTGIIEGAAINTETAVFQALVLGIADYSL